MLLHCYSSNLPESHVQRLLRTQYSVFKQKSKAVVINLYIETSLFMVIGHNDAYGMNGDHCKIYRYKSVTQYHAMTFTLT